MKVSGWLRSNRGDLFQINDHDYIVEILHIGTPNSIKELRRRRYHLVITNDIHLRITDNNNSRIVNDDKLGKVPTTIHILSRPVNRRGQLGVCSLPVKITDDDKSIVGSEQLSIVLLPSKETTTMMALA